MEASLHLPVRFQIVSLKVLFLDLLCSHIAYQRSLDFNVTLIINNSFHINPNLTTILTSFLKRAYLILIKWLANNRLRLNQVKSELIWCSFARRSASFMQPLISVECSIIRATDRVGDLEIIRQADMSMNDRISAVVRSIYYNIMQLLSICSSLTSDDLRDTAYASYPALTIAFFFI